MTVLVDTTIWSIALRRPSHRLSTAQRLLTTEWRRLIENNEAVIVGPIRQEILSGVRRATDFDRLREHIAGIDCIAIRVDDYDQAARFYNDLRGRGVTGSSVDLVICATAYRLGIPIFTTDDDFVRYARHLPIELHR